MSTYRLLSGVTVDLTELDERERGFLDDLMTMGKKGINYFEVYRMAIGPGSPALQGRNRVNQRILASGLYLVARDIATRVGIEQGLILAPEYEAERAKVKRNFSMVSVTQAAELIGITRAAVYKAIEAGKIDVQKIGNVTVVDKASAKEFLKRRSQPKAETTAGNSTSNTADTGDAEQQIAIQ